jgi:hypothetical protein
MDGNGSTTPREWVPSIALPAGAAHRCPPPLRGRIKVGGGVIRHAPASVVTQPTPHEGGKRISYIHFPFATDGWERIDRTERMGVFDCPARGRRASVSSPLVGED